MGMSWDYVTNLKWPGPYTDDLKMRVGPLTVFVAAGLRCLAYGWHIEDEDGVLLDNGSAGARHIAFNTALQFCYALLQEREPSSHKRRIRLSGPNGQPGTITWAEYLKGYRALLHRKDVLASPERVLDAGGLRWVAPSRWHNPGLAELLGHEPETWEPES